MQCSLGHAPAGCLWLQRRGHSVYSWWPFEFKLNRQVLGPGLSARAACTWRQFKTQVYQFISFLRSLSPSSLPLSPLGCQATEPRLSVVQRLQTMFEARLLQGQLLKKIIEAIKDLVTDANFDATENDFSLQAMDSSHVSLVALKLEKDGFEHYRCDKPISMGVRSRRSVSCSVSHAGTSQAADLPRQLCRHQSRTDVQDAKMCWIRRHHYIVGSRRCGQDHVCFRKPQCVAH